MKSAVALFMTGDILFGRLRPYLQKIVVAECDGAASAEFITLEPNQHAEIRFFLALLRTAKFLGYTTQVSSGDRPRVSYDSIADFPFSLPPLAEQRRIVAKLDALSAKSTRARTELASIEALVSRYKQAVLRKAFGGDLTEDWRSARAQKDDSMSEVLQVEGTRSRKLRMRAAADVMKEIQLHNLPDGWNWVENHRLAQDGANSICAGPFGTIFKAKDFRPSGIPIIFLRHVAEGQYLTHKPGFMDEFVWKELHQPYSVFGGELLVAKLGDPPGAACIYPKGMGIAMVTPDVIKMTVDDTVSVTKYLMHYFNSPVAKAVIEGLAFGLTRLRVDLSMFKNFPVPLAPMKEQHEVVRRIETAFARIDHVAAEARRALDLLGKLDEAILAKAFRGELVPQDETDEPADVLLDRIRAERASAPKAKRRGRAAAARS